MSGHPLDKPIWTALQTRQAHFDPKGKLARRFPLDVSPLAAAQNRTPAAIAALTDLIPSGDDISLLELAPPGPPAGVIATTAPVFQMTATSLSRGRQDSKLEPLGDTDAAEMLALALLTRPGPFRTRTHMLGRFLGIRDGSRLVAMAGERLQTDGFIEISAVCTHPDYRGRGYGAALMRAVGERILAEGATPFLHTYASNTGAIGLYRVLGFDVRREVVHAVWKRDASVI
ncbi:MAG: GNAT family N-acetyltransferase [Hyphomonadaceae bacterium]|nr:GNAT family N-acetyltransferase [Hyphomonadaceae bacterium]